MYLSLKILKHIKINYTHLESLLPPPIGIIVEVAKEIGLL